MRCLVLRCKLLGMNNSLVSKYNVAGPRYTSYPTVPYWDNNTFSAKNWKNSIIQSFEESNAKEGISIYIHLPFCESLCTFCGCHKRITKRHDVESPYINAVLKEWNLYLDLFKDKPIIKELHLGGGTPTFFSPENLKRLINGILRHSILSENYEFSFEGHPNNTTREHLLALYDVGFRRVSYGVQDYNETVQKSVRQRLAETLIYINSCFGTNSDGTLSVLLSREDFASMVGTATESAIRVLSQFKKERLIATIGKQIKILDLEGLKRVE